MTPKPEPLTSKTPTIKVVSPDVLPKASKSIEADSQEIVEETQETNEPFDPKRMDELELQTIMFNLSGHHQWSGLTLHQSKLIAVSDAHRKIYQLQLHKEGFKAVELHDFYDFEGFRNYAYQLRLKESKVKKVVDPEGVAFCYPNYYVVNEVKRHLMVFDIEKKTFSFQAFDFESLKKGERNAGLEGVARECEKNITVLAKERGPQALYLIEQDSVEGNQTSNEFVLPSSWRSEQIIIDPANGGKSMIKVGDAYTGLHIDWPYLYVLNRPTHTIEKYHLGQNRLVDRRSFFSSLRTLYNDLSLIHI